MSIFTLKKLLGITINLHLPETVLKTSSTNLVRVGVKQSDQNVSAVDDTIYTTNFVCRLVLSLCILLEVFFPKCEKALLLSL